jgi:hypothetical protein
MKPTQWCERKKIVTKLMVLLESLNGTIHSRTYIKAKINTQLGTFTYILGTFQDNFGVKVIKIPYWLNQTLIEMEWH